MSTAPTSDEHRSTAATGPPLGGDLAAEAAPRLGRVLWIIIAVSLTLHVACLIAGNTFLHDWRWLHYPIHAAVEMSGGLIALWVAWMLLSLERRQVGTSFNVWIAGALIGMGLLDGLHALFHAGEEFVWLHSTATFVGGSLFALVWAPKGWAQRVVTWWPWVVFIVVVPIGCLSLAYPDITPRMLVQNEQGDKVFSLWAQGLNVVGGVLLFAAAARLITTYFKNHNVDDLLFCLHCSLFGAAAVMFETSELWDLPWWGWHLLRLLAYGVALWFMVQTEMREQRTLVRLGDELKALTGVPALTRSKEVLKFAYLVAQGHSETGTEDSAIVRETGNELVGIASLDNAMDIWASQARFVIGAHQSAVSYVPHGNFAEGKHAISLSDDFKKYRTYDVLPTGEGIWRRVVCEKLSFCMTDEELKSHAGWKNFSDLLDERGLEHPPMRGWLAAPVLTEDGECIGVLQLSDKKEGDFTEEDLDLLKRLGRLIAPAFSLQAANEELHRHGEDLALAKSALEQSNIELQHFAYIASHDLQTPLRGIAGFAQFLQKDYQGKFDEKADDYIERIVQGTKRMHQLINDLLAYSRVESRSAPFQPTNLSEVFDDAVVLLRASIGDAGQLTRGELPTVAGDRSQLSQLLQNLIGNAIKYHGDQPPQIHVSAENGGGQWTIAVRDHGIGIAAKHHEEVFEIFRRLHTADKYPGTGIGLAICRRIVQRHGGKIWVESEGAEGTTFYFTIPERSEGEGGAAN